MSNNPLTSQTINRGKAEGQFEALAQAKDKKSLEGRIAAARLAGKSVNVVMQAAKKMAELEMIKSPNKDVDEEVRLEVALAAIGSRDFALAEYFLDELSESKNAKVKAAALNAFGVVALRDDRVPEAVLYFRQSLKALPGYRPAVLNLGFTALKGGELATAKRELSQMQNDWFVQYGLISVERMAGDVGSASSLCERVLKKEANHKAALYNCGLLEFQNKKQYKKALELVNKAARAPGGEAGWAERIQATETRIDQEQARAGAGGAGGNAKGPGKGK